MGHKRPKEMEGASNATTNNLPVDLCVWIVISRNLQGSKSSLLPSWWPIHLPLYIGGASLKEMGLMHSDDLIYVWTAANLSTGHRYTSLSLSRDLSVSKEKANPCRISTCKLQTWPFLFTSLIPSTDGTETSNQTKKILPKARASESTKN